MYEVHWSDKTTGERGVGNELVRPDASKALLAELREAFPNCTFTLIVAPINIATGERVRPPDIQWIKG